MPTQKLNMRGCRDGSVAKGPGSPAENQGSCRSLRLPSSSQLSATPVLGQPTLSSGLCGLLHVPGIYKPHRQMYMFIKKGRKGGRKRERKGGKKDLLDRNLPIIHWTGKVETGFPRIAG